MKLCILAEDTYGPVFIEQVIKKAIDNGLAPNSIKIVKSQHTYGRLKGAFNTANDRIIRSIRGLCSKVIVFIDADGQPEDQVRKRFLDTLSRESRGAVRLVVFSSSIEEWIMPHSENPADELKKKERYEKSDLPRYAERVELDALKGLKSFRDFLSFLNDP